jgi:methionyl-tRNA formyltransferase
MRAIVLTSTFLRHQHAVNRLAQRVDVVGVWQEQKSFVPERYATDAAEEAVIAKHFAARDASERTWFAADATLRVAASRVHRVGPNGCNAGEQIDVMRSASPDVVFVFGTGLLTRELIDCFPASIINLHLGVSPYYRGAGTNFWPLVNGEPELVGATIHCLDAGIDSGPMLAHVRPEMHVTDGPHDVGNRAIAAAAERLPGVARAYLEGRIAPVPQAGGGRLYRRADFTAASVIQLYKNFASGMLADYLGDKSNRDNRLRLLDPPESS